MSPVETAEERYATIVDAFSALPGVTPPAPPGPGKNVFGAGAIKVDNKIFAMLVRDDLVLKLPKQRVAALIGEGTALPFDAGKGKPMAEWATIPAAAAEQWLPMAREAFTFVGKRAVSG